MCILFKRSLVGFFLSSLCMLSYGDFWAASTNYDQKKYPEAVEEFKRLASLGQKESQFNVGVMYYRGEGVDINPVEAYAWTALAASNGVENYTKTRDLILAKLNADQKVQAFKRLEELLSQLGDQVLNEKLTPVLLSDVDCQFKLRPSKVERPSYPAEALRAGKNGSVDVDFTIDKYGYVRDYSVLVSTDKIFEKATIGALKKWRYEPVIIHGKAVDVAVQNARLKFTINGAVFNETAIKKYVDELRAKAEAGSPVNMYTLAYAGDLLRELHIEKRESNSWYLKAAQGGLPEAQYQIGKSLIRGEGCKADVPKGLEWLTLAAKDNSAEAQYFLGVSLLGSNEFQQNKKQGIEWLNHAVLANHVKAKMRLAWILATDKENAYYDPAKSLMLIIGIYDGYADKLRATETLAAAQAASGLFEEAVETQTKAIGFAKDIDYPLEVEQQRLLAYQSRQDGVNK